jgi:hypothetical protein
MATTETSGFEPKRAQALAEAENARLVAERPRSMALLEQARQVATFDDFPTEVT